MPSRTFGEAGHVGQGALKAEAEAGMQHRAVAVQIAVPAVMLGVDAALGHAAVQDVEPLLPPIISSIPIANTSIAATVRLSSMFGAALVTLALV
jgi:hypothetical protein